MQPPTIMLHVVTLISICLFIFASRSLIKGNVGANSIDEDDANEISWKEKQTFQAGAQVLFSSKMQSDGNFRKGATEDVRKMEECDNEFVTKLSHLLDHFNVSLKSQDIENLRTSLKVRTSKNRLSGLSFVVVLNLRKIYPEYEEGTKMTDETDDLTSIFKEPIIVKSFGQQALKKVRLQLTLDNIYQTNKSVVQIKTDIDFIQSYPRSGAENVYTYFERTGVVRNFFKAKNKSQRRKLRVQKFATQSIFAGSFLALLSSILCGLSFALKKWSLLRMDKGKSYYFDKKWWMSQSLMIIGDILHFIAFSFAPAIVVCTLQILTVIVTAVVSSKLLGEKLHKYGKLAFALSLGGCWVIVFHVPNEPQLYSIDTFLYLISSHIFLIYIAFLAITTVLLTSYWIPKYGEINSLAYTVQSSIFGSIIVIALKGVMLGYTDTLSHWLPWGSFVIGSVFLILQLEYLNKALEMYSTLVVTTQYYVLYSAFVILASCLLFKVWTTSSQEMIFTNFCGLLTIALGALILTIFEEANATFDFSKLFAGPEKGYKQK